MEILIMIIGVICALNLFVSIAIAGSVAKVIKYSDGEDNIHSEEASDQSRLQSGPLYKMENGELVEVGTPTYDQAVLQGSVEPYADGVTARPPTQNWDGIPN